jgi:hypothetical protein
VDGFGTRGLGGLQNALPAQIAVLGRAAADVHGLVAGRDMLGPGIGIRIHGHGLHTHATGGGGYAAGDFTSIRNQNFLEHIVSVYRSNHHSAHIHQTQAAMFFAMDPAHRQCRAGVEKSP